MSSMRPAVLAAVLALAAPVRGHAQDPLPVALATPWRLGELYRALDSASPQVRAAEAAVRAAGARASLAGRLPDPQVQFALMNRDLPGFGLNDPLGMNQVTVMQMVPFPGKRGLATGAARARERALEARAEDVRLAQRARAAMLLLDLWRADSAVQVMDGSVALLAELARAARAAYAAGEGRQADVLRADVELARMRGERTAMAAMRAGMAAQLNALLGRAADAAVPGVVRPAYAALPADTAVANRAVAGRAMLAAGRGELDAADLGLRAVRREGWPDLTFGATYGQRPMEMGTDRMLSLMVGASLPVWGRQRTMRREAEAMRDMAAADLAAMEADTRARAGELLAERARARDLAALYAGTILPQAEAAAAAALAGYRAGTAEVMAVLDAEMTVNRYRLERLQLVADEGRALAELEMLTGERWLDRGDAATGDDR